MEKNKNKHFLEELENGTEVTFNDGTNCGVGKIRGIAGIGTVILGKQYIVEYTTLVEISTNLDIDYKYPCIPMFELFIETI